MTSGVRRRRGRLRVVSKSRRWLPRGLRPGSTLARRISQTVRGALDVDEALRLDALGGWLGPDEGMTLFYFAYGPRCRGHIVEIGTFLGKSTAWMASALKHANAGEKVVTIDPHRYLRDIGNIYPVDDLQDQCGRIASRTGLSRDDISTYEVFEDNIAALGLSCYVDAIRDRSTVAAQDWSQPIRQLFVDGSHRYEDALADLRAWEPWVCRGGIICMHDTRVDGPWDGVLRAMREHLMTDGRFRHVLYTGNLTVFEKRAAGNAARSPASDGTGCGSSVRRVSPGGKP